MTAHSAEELGKAAQRAHQQQRIGTQTSRYTRSTLSGVAQSAEQRTVNPLVESSSLSPGATFLIWSGTLGHTKRTWDASLLTAMRRPVAPRNARRLLG